MVFRRDGNRVDSFQRQMNALRQQIGDDEQEVEENEMEQRDRYYQQEGRGRQQRPGGDEGYSFGSFPSSSSVHSDEFDADNAPAVPEMPGADQQVNIVAAGTTWKGDLDAQGSIHVYGKVNGTLNATEDVWIADGAEVDARIEADRVVIAGGVTGQITARSRFEALPNCEVQADIDAPTFVVHEGATVNGALSMRSSTLSPESDSRADRGRPGSIIQRRARTSS